MSPGRTGASRPARSWCSCRPRSPGGRPRRRTRSRSGTGRARPAPGGPPARTSRASPPGRCGRRRRPPARPGSGSASRAFRGGGRSSARRSPGRPSPPRPGGCGVRPRPAPAPRFPPAGTRSARRSGCGSSRSGRPSGLRRPSAPSRGRAAPRRRWRTRCRARPPAGRVRRGRRRRSRRAAGSPPTAGPRWCRRPGTGCGRRRTPRGRRGGGNRGRTTAAKVIAGVAVDRPRSRQTPGIPWAGPWAGSDGLRPPRPSSRGSWYSPGRSKIPKLLLGTEAGFVSRIACRSKTIILTSASIGHARSSPFNPGGEPVVTGRV